MTKVPRRFLEQLREDIAFRRIDSGIRLLESHQHLIDSCGPGQENGVVFLAHLAQWVDAGFAQPELIKNLLLRFPQAFRTTLPVRDFAHLQMAEGFVALLDQKNHEALQHFEIVLSIQAENHDDELITSANLWIGLCYRRQGRYHDALGYVIKARTLATKLKYPKLVAVLQVLEGWIAFQEGNSSEAGNILAKAEGLLETDDYIARGNINSIYGRIARRNGNYDQAIRRFEIAIKEYQKRDQKHRNIARCLVNIGLVERLLALQLQEKLDGDTARGKTEAKGVTPDTGPYQQRERQRLKGLRKMAFRRLADACTIYRRHRDYRGMGNVQVNLGYLWLDVGKLDVAAAQGAAAYSLASKRSDSVLKARSRILQSAVECAKYEEQIEEETTEVSTLSQCSRSACEYANEAVRAAEDTQNRRLKAKASIALGSAL
jgi:tetratricopeptide (TPR) repeat protein